MASNKFLILVVDDDHDKVMLLTVALQMAGYEVATANEGEWALKRIERDNPDLIIIDAKIPGMDGFELARRVRANPLTRFLPMIISTNSRHDELELRRGSEVGALGYITDPTDIDLLLARVRTLLDFKRYLDAVEEEGAIAKDKQIYLQKRLDSVEEERAKERSEYSAKDTDNSVVMSFDFPEEIKVSCEQYLLYFAQFLKDLGVKADTALTHEAGQVLFTVTPADKEQALDQIHAALDVYLHLASSPVSDTTNEAIEVQRLESNILRLRSDLKLAAAELQAKNATIQAQELTISVQKGLLSGEIIFDSLKDVTPKPKDREELLGGTLAIKKYEGKGFDVDLPVVFRRLKQLFTGKEDPNKNSGS
jgi:CheY-like chemotaxis protein